VVVSDDEDTIAPCFPAGHLICLDDISLRKFLQTPAGRSSGLQLILIKKHAERTDITVLAVDANR